MNEVFMFIDATHLIVRASLWEEQDDALKQKYDKLNNEVLPKVAHDKQARIGCKGKNNYWYGYKKHVSMDMQSGMINKVEVTPANLTDAQGMKQVCPSQGTMQTKAIAPHQLSRQQFATDVIWLRLRRII